MLFSELVLTCSFLEIVSASWESGGEDPYINFDFVHSARNCSVKRTASDASPETAIPILSSILNIFFWCLDWIRSSRFKVTSTIVVALLTKKLGLITRAHISKINLPCNQPLHRPASQPPRHLKKKTVGNKKVK